MNILHPFLAGLPQLRQAHPITCPCSRKTLLRISLLLFFFCYGGFVFSQTLITFQEKSSPDPAKKNQVGGISMSELYQIKVNSIDGTEISLDFLRGKVALVVNVASRCGFTQQYQGLEELYRKYKDKGLVILGFPCNQFGGQEPGTAEEIKDFCRINYGVSFDMFEKIDVNGDNAHPIFAYLTDKLPGIPGKAIKWNFTKFLLDKDGNPVERFASTATPQDIEPAIEKLL